MRPLYQDDGFTFQFAEDRLVRRFHLEGVEAGRGVTVFALDLTGRRGGILAETMVGDGGWVELAGPLVVRAGGGFVVVPESGVLADSVNGVMSAPLIRPVHSDDRAEWVRMRCLLWPGESTEEHAQEVATFFRTGSFRWSESLPVVAVFVAVRASGGLCGFLEASIRPFADACQSLPVGYVEGWFVDADIRQQNVGRRLVVAAEQWATTHGCQELASDTEVGNTVSLSAHLALGFEESSRIIQLRKRLAGAPEQANERSDPGPV